MKLGDLVIVVGVLDKRIREKQANGLVKGTLFQFLCDEQVCVILEDMDLFVGLKRDIRELKEQE